MVVTLRDPRTFHNEYLTEHWISREDYDIIQDILHSCIKMTKAYSGNEIFPYISHVVLHSCYLIP